jgi:hypothetical protein
LILYGICIGSESTYQAYAAAGLRQVHATSRVLESRDNDSIFPAYNELLDRAREHADLEALVLLHEDLEIRDAAFEDNVRAQFVDRDVAILGTIGGRGPRSVRWSQSREVYGRQPDAFYGPNDHGGGIVEVDIVDGCILVLSPWAVRNLRFDEERFHGFHAYDADICMQARAAGRLVKVIELDTFHHTKGGLGVADLGAIREHQRADDAFRRKWAIPRDPLPARLKRRYPSASRAISKLRRTLVPR